jgi:hypothetical protein
MGNEICSVFRSEDHGLRVLENEQIRKVFGPKMDEVAVNRKEKISFRRAS